MHPVLLCLAGLLVVLSLNELITLFLLLLGGELE